MFAGRFVLDIWRGSECASVAVLKVFHRFQFFFEVLVIETDSTISSLVMPFLTIRHVPINVRNVMFLQNSFLFYSCFKCQWSNINVFFSKWLLRSSLSCGYNAKR